MLGYSREELIGKTPLDLATEEFKQFLITNRETILSKKRRVIEGSCIAKDGHMFGKDRFRSIIRDNAKTGANDILNAVYDELSRYTRGQRPEDDITLVIIKVDGLI